MDPVTKGVLVAGTGSRRPSTMHGSRAADSQNKGKVRAEQGQVRVERNTKVEKCPVKMSILRGGRINQGSRQIGIGANMQV